MGVCEREGAKTAAFIFPRKARIAPEEGVFFFLSCNSIDEGAIVCWLRCSLLYFGPGFPFPSFLLFFYSSFFAKHTEVALVALYNCAQIMVAHDAQLSDHFFMARWASDCG